MFEKEDRVSDLVVAPTVTAVEMQPGEPTNGLYPLLPEEIVVKTPAFRRWSIADFCTASSQASLCWPPPRLMLTDATLMEPFRKSWPKT